MTEQIKFQFREDDNEEWKDVVNGMGDFVEPSWCEGFQYHLRPEPELITPKWPESKMSYRELCDASDGTNKCWNSEQARDVANAAVAHALDTGLVVLPNSIPSSVQNINYKKDAEEWGVALNEAAWKFIEDNPEKSALLFNTCKTSLRVAILEYLEMVEKEVV